MKKFQACLALFCAWLMVSLPFTAHAEQRITGCGLVDDDECLSDGQTMTNK